VCVGVRNFTDENHHTHTSQMQDVFYARGTAKTLMLSLTDQGTLLALALNVVTNCTAPLLMLYFANTLLSMNCHQS
jgi:hypothetical protein